METSIMVEVKCDDCGDKMMVNKEEFMHPRCVLTFCDLCMSKTDEDEGVDDYTPHHVIGINKGQS